MAEDGSDRALRGVIAVLAVALVEPHPMAWEGGLS